MSDLISRKTLIKTLESDDSLKHARRLFTAYLNEQPTAFDVDEVSGKLNELFVDIVTEGDATAINHWNDAINKCINIVEGAVKNE